jgi:hypothetical protein
MATVTKLDAIVLEEEFVTIPVASVIVFQASSVPVVSIKLLLCNEAGRDFSGS